MRTFLSHRAGMIGLAILLILVGSALLAPIVAPHDPDALNPINPLAPPSVDALLGTDRLGRDELSRLIFASRVSLIVAIGSMLIAMLIGVPLGVAAGFCLGRVDSYLGRLYEAVQALPPLIFFIVVVAVFGPGLTVVTAAIGAISSVLFFRVARSTAAAVSAETFIEATRALGATRWWIVRRHVVPNIMAPLLVRMTIGAGVAVTSEGSLSFLGLGVSAPTPTWGNMLAEGAQTIEQAPHLVYAPGVMLLATVLAFSLLGDGLNDAFGTGRSNVKVKR